MKPAGFTRTAGVGRSTRSMAVAVPSLLAADIVSADGTATVMERVLHGQLVQVVEPAPWL